MSYNGSGTFTINSTGQPVVAGTVITASAFNALTTDLATGLTTAITKDGQTTTTARITFAQGFTSSLTTDSSSVSTGSIITDGGVGIAKNLYVGGTLNVTGSTSLTNPVINNIKMGYTTTATAAGTTTLTISSNYRQFFTGSTTQTIVLPVTSTLVTGIAYEIENNSTGTLTVNSSGGNLVGTIPSGVCAHAVCIGTTLTTAADWDWDYISTTTITGTGANVLGTSPTIATPTITGDASISGLTVGKGGGAVSTNTAVGASALANASNTGANNAAFGSNVLSVNTSGGVNAGFGINSLAANTTGGNNAGFGVASLSANTTGSFNVACGQAALQNNTTSSYLTAVGYQAGYTNSTGPYNTFVGAQAGYSSTGGENTCVGRTAGYFISTGTGNTFIGPGNGATSNGAGYYVTTGSKNSILGGYNGNQGGLDIRTASNYIVLSDGDGNPRLIGNGSGDFAIGRNPVANIALALSRANTADETLYAVNTASSGVTTSITSFSFNGYSPNNTSARFLYCGDTTAERLTIRSNGGIANYSANNVNLSDQREKKNIEIAGNYLDKICQIPVKTFLLNDQTDEDLNLGVIAQDVQAVCPELVTESDWASKGEEPKMRLSIYQTDLQYALMKSIQELKTIVDAQATEITALKAKVGI